MFCRVKASVEFIAALSVYLFCSMLLSGLFLLSHHLLLSLKYLSSGSFFTAQVLPVGVVRGQRKTGLTAVHVSHLEYTSMEPTVFTLFGLHFTASLLQTSIHSLLLPSNLNLSHHFFLHSPLSFPWPLMMFFSVCDKRLKMNYITFDSVKSYSASQTIEIHLVRKKPKWCCKSGIFACLNQSIGSWVNHSPQTCSL